MGGQKVSIYVIVMQVHMLFHDCGAYKWKLNVSFFSYLAKRVKTTMDMKTCLQFSPFMKCSLKVSQRFLFFLLPAGVSKIHLLKNSILRLFF